MLDLQRTPKLDKTICDGHRKAFEPVKITRVPDMQSALGSHVKTHVKHKAKLTHTMRTLTIVIATATTSTIGIIAASAVAAPSAVVAAGAFGIIIVIITDFEHLSFFVA